MAVLRRYWPGDAFFPSDSGAVSPENRDEIAKTKIASTTTPIATHAHIGSPDLRAKTAWLPLVLVASLPEIELPGRSTSTETSGKACRGFCWTGIPGKLSPERLGDGSDSGTDWNGGCPGISTWIGTGRSELTVTC